MSEESPPLTETGPAVLWFVRTERVEDPAVRDRWLACLEPQERSRYSAYRSLAAKDEYLATRALARAALSLYTGRPAELLRFRADRGERPELISPSIPGLSFSLANTRELAVGLFALELEVGVDVELEAPIAELELAGRFFSSREQAELSSLGADARRTRFYELWTLREAYLKARGLGLTLPLEEVAFAPAADGGVRASFGPAIGDRPARWQFELHRLGGRHLAATCVQRSPPRAAARIVPFDARDFVGAPSSQPSG